MAVAAGRKPQNPDWTGDEHILALDVYLSAKPGQPQKGHVWAETEVKLPGPQVAPSMH
jgi:hypothetical protein